MYKSALSSFKFAISISSLTQDTNMKSILVLIGMFSIVMSQRPYYAGRRPVGYGETGSWYQTEATLAPGDTNTTNTDGTLVNRAGDGDNAIEGTNTNTGPTTTTTTERLPVDALGDRELIDRISKWPVDKQPYWYINWRQIEAQRQRPVVPQAEYRPSFFHSQNRQQWNYPNPNPNPSPNPQNNNNRN